ncbi:MAG: alpha/beta hydrolase [Chloroflexi bacterium]|nr:alpha/beta hydrolase [Chloroflexota bacterium]
MPIIETSRGKFHFLATNAAAPGTPLLLVHGAGGQARAWPPQLRRLPGQPVFAVDLPGHGESEAPGRSRISDYAADLAALQESAGWPPSVVAGHSMGGAIALQMALEFPQQVAALILIGSGARLVVNPAILAESLSDPAAVIARIQRWQWAPGSDPALIEQGAAQLSATPPQVLHDDYLACDRFDLRARLAEIEQATLVCCGTLDRMTPPPLSEELAADLPKAELRTFPGGGHMLPLEQAQAMARVLEEWLSSLS